MNPRARVLAGAALLLPLGALASFNGPLCKGDFGCTWSLIGLVFGAAGGIPVSVVLFAGVHWFFCHPERSKKKQLWVGVVLGVLAFELWAAVPAYVMIIEETQAGLSRALSALAMLASYLLLLGLSFLYVRSSPR